jgi:hypothetical protein
MTPLNPVSREAMCQLHDRLCHDIWLIKTSAAFHKGNPNTLKRLKTLETQCNVIVNLINA